MTLLTSNYYSKTEGAMGLAGLRENKNKIAVMRDLNSAICGINSFSMRYCEKNL